MKEHCPGIGPADMARAIQTGGTHRANAKMALHVLEIMEAIHVSSDERKQVKLTSTCAKPEMMPII